MFQENLSQFDAKYEETVNQLSSPIIRLVEYFDILPRLDSKLEVPDISELSEMDKSLVGADYDEILALLAKGDYEDIERLFDEKFAGGALRVLNADTEAKKRFVSIRAFEALSNIDWDYLDEATMDPGSFMAHHLQKVFQQLDNPIDSDESHDGIEKSAKSLFNFFLLKFIKDESFQRHKLIEVYQDAILLAELTGISVQKDFMLIASFLNERNESQSTDTESENAISKIAARLTAGSRWNKLAELFGEDIILLGGPLSEIDPDSSPLTDIPTAVDKSTDEEFSNLVEIISPSYGWLKETCHKMNGLSKIIMAVFGASQAEKHALVSQIKGRVLSAFGDPESIREITMKATDENLKQFLSSRFTSTSEMATED